jgi:predicted ABC-type ATPase
MDLLDWNIVSAAGRASRGGHDIPVEKIHQRWRSSRENLIRLMPYIHHLRMYDNSYEADPVAGKQPRPILLLETREQKITAPSDLSGAPEWAQPVLAAAMILHRTINS